MAEDRGTGGTGGTGGGTGGTGGGTGRTGVSLVSLLLLLLLLPLTASKHLSSVTVREGAAVTLSCGNVRDDQDGCDATTWIFSEYGSVKVTLVENGTISADAGEKSGGLRVGEDCSLVIQTASWFTDGGLYVCRQLNTTGRPQADDSLVLLTVVLMYEQQEDEENVTLNCHYSTYGLFPHVVRWSYRGQAVAENHSVLSSSRSDSMATVSFQTSHHVYGSSSNFLSCEVLDDLFGQPVTYSLQTAPESSEVAASKHLSSVTVAARADVTLSCGNVTDDQDGCGNTTWIYRDNWNKETRTLSEHGRILGDAAEKSDRLRVRDDCSLVVETVSVSDAGLYACRRGDDTPGPQPDDSLVLLTVVLMTEQKDEDNVTLICSVRTFGPCPDSVAWWYEGEGLGEVVMSQSRCKATARYQESQHVDGSSSDFLSCTVSGDPSQPPMTFLLPPPERTAWWWIIVVTVALAALMVVVVYVNLHERRRQKFVIKDRDVPDATSIRLMAVSQVHDDAQ